MQPERYVAACGALGSLLRVGFGVTKDSKRAQALLRRACDTKDARACNGLALLVEEGDVDGKDPKLAASHYERACSLGYGFACSNLAKLALAGNGTPKSPQRALELFRKSCTLGSDEGCRLLASTTWEGQEPTSIVGAAAEGLGRLCSKGQLRSCLDAGLLYDGQSVLANRPELAIPFYERACEQGVAGGCNNLGIMLQNGRGIGKDPARAASLYAKGCEAGSLNACFNHALMLNSDSGVPRDEAQAKRLTQKACDGGLKLACESLAQQAKSAEPATPVVSSPRTPVDAPPVSPQPLAASEPEPSTPLRTWETIGHFGFIMGFVSEATSNRAKMSRSGGLIDLSLGTTLYSYFAVGAEGGWMMFEDASPPEENKLDAHVSLFHGGLFAGLRSPPIVTGNGGFRLGANVGHDWISASRSYSYAGDVVTCGSGGCSSTHKDSVDFNGGNFLEGFVAYGFASKSWGRVVGLALGYREFLDGDLARMASLRFGG